MSALKPAYIETFKKSLLREKVKTAGKILSFCKLCPRECGVDRLTGQTGECNTGEKAFVSSYHSHFGEEAPLVGTGGSGTIFFYTLQPIVSFLSKLRYKP